MQLARAMRAAGISLVGVEARSAHSRSRARRALPGVPVFSPSHPLPPATALLIAVPDSAIAECARDLAIRVHRSTSVAVHTSGLVPASALGPLAAAGCSVAGMHPLVSFPSAAGPRVPLAGVAAAVEGRGTAAAQAAGLARALSMKPFRLREAEKPRYHAAAALASNMTHVLVATARVLLVETGLPQRIAASALHPLVAGSVEAAVAARGLERLTGPVARADAPAVIADLHALPRAARSAYGAVARLAVGALEDQGLVNPGQARRLRSALTASA